MKKSAINTNSVSCISLYFKYCFIMVFPLHSEESLYSVTSNSIKKTPGNKSHRGSSLYASEELDRCGYIPAISLKTKITHYVYRETSLSPLYMAFTLLSKLNGHVSLILTGSWHTGRLLSRHPATRCTPMPQPSLQSSPSKICRYMLHGQRSTEVHEITYG